MSMNRKCAVPGCGELENIRFNFGDNYEAEKAFHKELYYCEDHSKYYNEEENIMNNEK